MKLLLIITGSIASVKCFELISILKKKGVDVTCVLTKGGAEFIQPLSLASLTGNKVYSDLFDLTDETEMGHIRLARDFDKILVCPASADFMAKVANGLCNDLASTIISATDTPVIFAPAMNVEMWANKANKRNIEQLKEDGFEIIEPASGELACGEYGAGRLAEINDIIDYLQGAQPLLGKKVVITYGATLEPLDNVRYISNYSSGKQGLAIIDSLKNAGAEVIGITGGTTQGMHDKVMESLPADVFISCAAVCDYKPEKKIDGKIKKTAENHLDLRLIKNPDILNNVSNNSGDKRPAIVVGFAAEDGDLEKNALDKYERKNCDILVGNHVNGGKIFGADVTSGIIFSDTNKNFDNITKKQLADLLTEEICQKIGK